VTDGVLLQPAALVRGLADTLPANVRLYEQSPALKIEDGEPLTIQLANGEVKADKLIRKVFAIIWSLTSNPGNRLSAATFRL
jgi:glycine/D-amino acid oxidase-like deaminating enzyme